MEEKPEENNSNFIGMENGIFIVGIPRPQHALKQYWIRSKTELLAGIANSFPSNYIITHIYTHSQWNVSVIVVGLDWIYFELCRGIHTKNPFHSLYLYRESIWFQVFFSCVHSHSRWIFFVVLSLNSAVQKTKAQIHNGQGDKKWLYLQTIFLLCTLHRYLLGWQSIVLDRYPFNPINGNFPPSQRVAC